MRLFATFCAFLTTIFLSAQVRLTQSNLPIFIINTNGLVIPNEPKINVNLRVIWNSDGKINRLSDTSGTLHYNGRLGIEMRGSTSQSLSDKKPYSIELRDAKGDDLDFALLGLPKEADWALIAPFSDKSLMRDALIYRLAGSFMAWAPRTRFCELIINGNYQGVYVLTERIKRDKNRVNISKMDSTSISGDALTGGYILKIDKSTGESSGTDFGFNSQYSNSSSSNSKRTFYIYHYPEPEDIKKEQKDYIKKFIADFEAVMNSNNYKDTLNGYAKYIDVNSFVDFLIANELTRNVDGYRLSTFLYKDKNSINGKLKMGPVWDFNIAFGNANYCDGGKTSGWAFNFNEVCPTDGWGIPFYWARLWADDNFKGRVKKRWKELRANQLSNDRVMGIIDSMNTVLFEASERNFQQWKILGKWVWPNNYVGSTYSSEVFYLKSWIGERMFWLDGQIANLADSVVTIKPLNYRVYPNPSSVGFTFEYNSIQTTNAELRIFNYMGQLVETIRIKQSVGAQRIEWKSTAAAGLYYYELTSGDKKIATGKLIKN